MGRLKDIAEGTRAIKRITVRLCNMPCALLPDIPELAAQREQDRAAWQAAQAAQPGAAPPIAPDQSVEIGLRVLSGEENGLVLQKAADYATRKGAKKCDESDPVYNFAVSVYTCAIACVDPDSDPKNPARFFGEEIDGAAEALLKSPHFGRDGIIYLSEQHEVWQDANNPQALKLDIARMWQLVGEVAASPDAGPFLNLRPGLRQSFVRFMAALLTSLLSDKSLFGLLSGTDGTSGTTQSSSNPSGEPQLS